MQNKNNNLPLIIQTEPNSKEYRYINPKFTIRRDAIKSKFISNTTLILKNSNRNRGGGGFSNWGGYSQYDIFNATTHYTGNRCIIKTELKE